MSVDDNSSVGQNDLLVSARSGSDDALAQLLDCDQEYLLLVARSELDSDLIVKASGSDVVQDSLLEAQQSFEQFRGESRADWRHWLKAILINNIRDVRRRYIETDKRSLQREVNRTVARTIQTTMQNHRHRSLGEKSNLSVWNNSSINSRTTINKQCVCGSGNNFPMTRWPSEWKALRKLFARFCFERWGR